jgi:hypothetical protein
MEVLLFWRTFKYKDFYFHPNKGTKFLYSEKMYYLLSWRTYIYSAYVFSVFARTLDLLSFKPTYFYR